MKLRIELARDTAENTAFEEEVVIRCQSISEEVKLLQNLISEAINKSAELSLYIGNSQYYVPRDEILFFETDDGRTAAHTSEKMYYTHHRLYKLEQLLPANFVRVSKSCILNAGKICTIHKNLAGASEVLFRNSHKKVYVSRMYYKVLKERIDEMRSENQL